MSKNINTVIIAGHACKDAEQRITQNGSVVLRFTLAVNDIKKTPAGEWEQVANFFDCTMFGERAERIAPYILKGSKLVVNGRLHQSKWDGEDGKTHSRVDIIVQDIELPPRPQQASAQYAQPTSQMPPAPPAPPAYTTQANKLIDVQTTIPAAQISDDIPF